MLLYLNIELILDSHVKSNINQGEIYTSIYFIEMMKIILIAVILALAVAKED
jgi:hypothetical protein